jgi:hypothetical protein
MLMPTLLSMPLLLLILLLITLIADVYCFA